eukprot:snap_masked-scaffold_32-processed-gene-2.29-mRNA-1 protein AED:1.00 eAED:1.00 QI:0/0/0/0/1/1/2/0/59
MFETCLFSMDIVELHIVTARKYYASLRISNTWGRNMLKQYPINCFLDHLCWTHTLGNSV